jgi:hypothetical protein
MMRDDSEAGLALVDLLNRVESGGLSTARVGRKIYCLPSMMRRTLPVKAILSIFTTAANLAAALNNLSQVIDAAARLRHQIDGENAERILEHQPAEEEPAANGRRRKPAAT